MSEYEHLRNDLDALAESFTSYAGTVNRYTEAVNTEMARLWADNAELRDEINAVANRVEMLTRAVMADPAAVAERMLDRG